MKDAQALSPQPGRDLAILLEGRECPAPRIEEVPVVRVREPPDEAPQPPLFREDVVGQVEADLGR